jgi:hypothetical protein
VWYGDRIALSLIGRRYLPWLAMLNLGWEIIQLPLYTIWREASPGYIAFAVAHCTAGDLLIGSAALVLALIATHAGPPAQWQWTKVAVVTALIGAAYSIASEWLNTSITRSWSYSELMPTIGLPGGVPLGLSPVAQWLLLPPLAVWLTRRSLA